MTGIVDFRASLLDEDGNPITNLNPLPVTGGGGGGGGGTLSDTVFEDSTGQLFVYRDTGSGTPTAYAVPAWTTYTVVPPITAAGGGGGGGSKLADTVFVDAAGQLFVYRDIGHPHIPLAYSIPTWDHYTPVAPVSYPSSTEEVEAILLRLYNLMTSPMGFDKSLSRQRVTGIIESGTITTVTTVTTATTVGTVTNLGAGRTGIELQDNQNRSAWAACVRARIT